jgi:hypothetical protein
VSSEPPPPPQLSPDGKFYWDGQRWVPVQAPAPSQRWATRGVPCVTNVGCLIIIGIVIVLVIIGLVAGNR